MSSGLSSFRSSFCLLALLCLLSSLLFAESPGSSVSLSRSRRLFAAAALARSYASIASPTKEHKGNVSEDVAPFLERAEIDALHEGIVFSGRRDSLPEGLEAVAVGGGRTTAEQRGELAKVALFYYASRGFSDAISESSIGTYYRGFVRRYEGIRSYATFGLSRTEEGLSFERLSREEEKERGASSRSFIKLNIRPSVRSGLEPRLTVADKLTLSHSLLEGKTDLRFSLRF